jgi:hypothetical protein
MERGARQCVFATWARHMRRGEFERAWEISDIVLHSQAPRPRDDLPRHLQQLWRGIGLDDKRVLIRCYHGLGDTIQFIRYAPLVKAIAKEVGAAVQPELIGLLRNMRGIDRLLRLEADDREAKYDIDLEVMELPYAFRTTVDTIPAEIPYLQVDPASLLKDGDLAVGIVWAAGDWDHRRSIPFPLVAPLADITGIRLHVLQHGSALRERPARFGVDSRCDDLLEAARLVRALDLVISVDSMPAHLAGALGVPVWTLLHAEADWRWMDGRNDSPWYPTMRLFRQEHPDQWEPVIAAVAAELAQLSDQKQRGAFEHRIQRMGREIGVRRQEPTSSSSYRATMTLEQLFQI